jgi:molybdenum cofactor cytidylyltransferase
MKVLGVIPAAGRSSRMGNPKPLLDAGGRNFLERVAAALRDGGATELIVGVRSEKGPIAAAALAAGARVVVPESVDDGPIATIREAIRSAEGDPEIQGLLLLPVDHPRVKAGTVAALLQAAFSPSDGNPDTLARASPSAPIVIPVHRGKWGHPVFLSREVFPDLLEPELEEGARTVVERHRDRVLQVEVDDAGVLADLNTLADYRRHFPDSFRRRFQKW